MNYQDKFRDEHGFAGNLFALGFPTMEKTTSFK